MHGLGPRSSLRPASTRDGWASSACSVFGVAGGARRTLLLAGGPLPDLPGVRDQRGRHNSAAGYYSVSQIAASQRQRHNTGRVSRAVSAPRSGPRRHSGDPGSRQQDAGRPSDATGWALRDTDPAQQPARRLSRVRCGGPDAADAEPDTTDPTPAISGRRPTPHDTVFTIPPPDADTTDLTAPECRLRPETLTQTGSTATHRGPTTLDGPFGRYASAGLAFRPARPVSPS